jgi:hypothetical protein
MSLEQLALIFILKNMGRVEDVKKHLVASLREMTLAMASSLAIINQTATEHNLVGRFPLADTLIKKIDVLLQYACSLMPAPNESARLKAEVLGSVIDILDEESTRLKRLPDASSAIQRKALLSLRKALANRLQGGSGSENDANDLVDNAENDASSTPFSSPTKRPASF